MRYKTEGVPLVVFAGKEYAPAPAATGRPRARGCSAFAPSSPSPSSASTAPIWSVWRPAAGLRGGQSWQGLGIIGNETVTIRGLTGLKPRQKLTVTIASADGKARDIEVLCRIDTEEELSYYRHGGILPFVLRNLASAA